MRKGLGNSLLSLALLALAIIIPTVASRSYVTVKSVLGPLRGERLLADYGYPYVAFKGIRYAKPPVKDLRFEIPVPLEPWDDVRDSLADGEVCPQFDIGADEPVGNEDCLFLNVYTPSVDKEHPVIVYLHGGEFVVGGASSTYFGPEYFIEQGVTLVTVQYRLGALGFLSTGDHALSGNLGIHDQIAALKWVKKNIKSFGGNPAEITLAGEGSGAASATMIAMTTQAKGLFQRVMAMSGNILCDQYVQTDPKEAATELGNRLECEAKSSGSLVACLKKVSAEKLVRHANNMYTFFSFPRWFVPTVDQVLLTDSPSELLQQGKFPDVPVLLGQTKDEGAFYYRLTMNAFSSGKYDDTFIDQRLPRMLPALTHFKKKLLPITRAVRKRYFMNVDLEDENQFRPKYIQLLTDLLYTRCIDQFARVLANNSVPVFRYVFEYRGQYSIVNFQGEKDDLGVAHGDDLQYMFNNMWGEELPMSASDLAFGKNKYMPLIVNFAKFGVPTPRLTEDVTTSWTPMSTDKPRILRIGTNLTLENDWRPEISRFWNVDVTAIVLAAGKSAPAKSKDEL